MTKHPDCEDKCQLLEHKGYHSCSISGECAWLEQDKINSYANAKIKNPEPIGHDYKEIWNGEHVEQVRK